MADPSPQGAPHVTVLVVAGSPDASSVQLTRDLASTHDLIVACDGGLRLLRISSVDPDIVIGDMDSATPEDIAFAHHAHASFLEFPVEKDETDLVLALDHIRYLAGKAGWDVAVTLTGTHGGRLDHELAILGACLRSEDLDPLIVEEGSVGAFLHASEEPLRISDVRARALGNPPREISGSTASIIALSGPLTLSTQGMRWDLDHDTINPLDSLGISNRIVDPSAWIHVTAGEGLLQLEL